MAKHMIRLMSIVIALSMLLESLALPLVGSSNSTVDLIVQARSESELSALAVDIERSGGEVTRNLAVINALAVRMPTDAVHRLERLTSAERLWIDHDVQSSDSLDPGTIYFPATGVEYAPASFDLAKVSACDKDREGLKSVGLHVIDPNAHQAYTFTPNVDANNLPASIRLHILFKEMNLSAVRLQVWQNSTQIWHPFDIDPFVSDNKNIDADFELAQLLQSPEDLALVKVRLMASYDGGDIKARVDCIQLNLQNYSAGTPDVLLSPSAGSEYKSLPIDLAKVASIDGDMKAYARLPLGAIGHNQFQSYSFAPAVDPNELPDLNDLRFVLKEKNLGQAYLEVYQISTGVWHRLDIDTQATDGKMIDTLFDLGDILETPEDYANIEVRFYAHGNDEDAKAKVDLINLRLASLDGEATTVDPSSSIVALNAAPVWAGGNLGGGVGIAVLDTGVKRYRDLAKDTNNQKTGLAQGWSALTGKDNGRRDKNGHGTIIASVASNRGRNDSGQFFGVAADSVVIPIQVLDKHGQGSYSQVIAGIQWAIDHKDLHNIRVMNLSLSAPVRSYYWDDPLNLAVMRAWKAGIVVVVAAGNGGPSPMTIGVPGNNPYVITVGALTDAYTPENWSDDYIPTFSAAGPTFEGFVKPDVVAPGGHIVGLMSDKSTLAKNHPEFMLDMDYYQLTGTSMSTAQVSGVVALMLANAPQLSPNEVKYHLLASAVPAINPNVDRAVSIWQQGAGRVDAHRAVYGQYDGAANQGLDIQADLGGAEHYGGYTRWNPETDQFFVVNEEGHAWSETYTWSGGHAWSEAFAWGEGHAWSEAIIWSGGHAWSEVFVWGEGHAWSEAILVWIEGHAWSEAILEWLTQQISTQTANWNDGLITLVEWVPEE